MAKKVPGIRKKGNGYECRVTVRGRTVSAHAGTMDEAKSKLAELRTQLESGTYVKRQNVTMTFSKYFDYWIELKRTRDKVAKSTIRLYKNVYKYYIADELGNRPIQDIKAKDIDKLLIIHSDELKKASLVLIRVIITSMFKRATFEEIIRYNPCSSLPKTPGKKSSKCATHRRLDKKEIRDFLTEAKNINDWYLNFYKFMLWAGTRCGEAAGIELRDLDFKNGVIHIRRTATMDEKGKSIIGDCTKTEAGVRDIPMIDEIREVIKNQRIINRTFFGKESDDFESRLFYLESGGIVTPSSVNFRIGIVIDSFNTQHPNDKLKRFTTHAFRDTFASCKVMRGTNNIKTVSALLGHASVRTTLDKYVDVPDEEKIRAMQTA